MGDPPTGSRKSRESPLSAPTSPACPALTELARMEHYVLSIDVACNLLLAQRTTARFERAAAIEACFQRIEQVLADVRREHFVLVVDARNGPSRNDVTFESVVAEHRGKLLFGFAKNAAVAATAAGRLQIQRYAKSDDRVVFVTDSPAAAFEYLGLPPHVV
jgi:hypothetical protein